MLTINRLNVPEVAEYRQDGIRPDHVVSYAERHPADSCWYGVALCPSLDLVARTAPVRFTSPEDAAAMARLDLLAMLEVRS